MKTVRCGVKLTKGKDGIWLLVQRRAGRSGLRLTGTLLETWAREQLGETVEKPKCSTPKCRRNPVLGLLGNHPLCRECGNEKNRKSRARSARARAAGHYSPSIIARMSPEKRLRLGLSL